MSSRSKAPSDLLLPQVPPTLNGGMSLPACAVLVVVCPGGAAWPRPVLIMRAALPADTPPAELPLLRTAPSGIGPWVPPSPPSGSVYCTPPAPTTSGNWSPFMSRKSTCPVLSPVARLPPTLPAPPPTLPVSEIWSDRDSRGTAVPPAKSDGLGSLAESTPIRELLALSEATQECCPLSHRASCGDGRN